MKTEKANQEQETAVVPSQAKEVVTELTIENITKWKAQYGKVFRSIIDGETFVWRKLKRKDYTTIMDGAIGATIYEKQEEITKACTLFPGNIDELITDNGGLATAISDEIMRKSGFDIEDTTEL